MNRFEAGKTYVFEWIEDEKNSKLFSSKIVHSYIGKTKKIDNKKIYFDEIYEAFGSGADFNVTEKKEFEIQNIKIYSSDDTLEKEIEKVKKFISKKKEMEI